MMVSTMGRIFQNAGVETVADNDRKAHTKAVRDAWTKFGINVWPGARIVSDRTIISAYTGKDDARSEGGSQKR